MTHGQHSFVIQFQFRGKFSAGLALAEAGQLPNIHQRINLFHVVQQVVASFEALAGENGIHLSLIAGEEDFTVKMDPRHIEQILHNLLSNSIKNTPSSGNIVVHLEREEKGVLLSVTDTGRGIPADELPFIFDRFYRRNESRRRDADGSGLGLTITKKIVEQLRGSIEVVSEYGKGSIFNVYLPD